MKMGVATMVVRNMGQVIARLELLSVATGQDALKDAARAGAEVVATQWAGNVPEDEGNYRASIKAEVASGAINDFVGGHTGRGEAASTVYPHRVGVEDSQEPFRYAGKLEFGGIVGRGAYIPPGGYARAAAEASEDAAIAAMSSSLLARIAKVA